MLENIRFVILFDMSLNLRFKMAASFPNVARTAVSISKFIYQGRFQMIKNWVFILKKKLNELKTS